MRGHCLFIGPEHQGLRRRVDLDVEMDVLIVGYAAAVCCSVGQFPQLYLIRLFQNGGADKVTEVQDLAHKSGDASGTIQNAFFNLFPTLVVQLHPGVDEHLGEAGKHIQRSPYFVGNLLKESGLHAGGFFRLGTGYLQSLVGFFKAD